jgi:hypothetical protein
MVSSVDPSIESPRSTNLDRPSLGSPGLDRNASIQRHRPWCVSLRISQSFGAVRRRTRNIVGPVTTVPSRIAFPMRKRAAGAFRKGHGPRCHPPQDAVGAAGARLASPPFPVLIDSCLSTRAGMRTAPCRRRPSSLDPRYRVDPQPTAKRRSAPHFQPHQKRPTRCIHPTVGGAVLLIEEVLHADRQAHPPGDVPPAPHVEDRVPGQAIRAQ